MENFFKNERDHLVQIEFYYYGFIGFHQIRRENGMKIMFNQKIHITGTVLPSDSCSYIV